jgi:hypothetical protein
MNDFINEVIKRIKSNPMEIAYSAVIFIVIAPVACHRTALSA